MAPRYLLIYFRPGADRARLDQFAQATGLTVAHSEGNLAVLVQGPVICLPLRSEGVIVGTLLERKGPPRPLVELSPSQADEILAGRGRVLAERYWGMFVAAFADGERLVTMRDPSAGIGCYGHDAGWAVAIASDGELLRATICPASAIHWDAIARQFLTPGLPSEQTALERMSEVLPGTAKTWGNASPAVETIWSPWSFCQVRDDDDATLQEQLRRAVQQSVSGLAARHQSLVAGVSGGLDSSIVASCLAGRAGDLMCVTVATSAPAGDERAHARLVCDFLDLELAEAHYDVEHIDPGRSAAPRLPRPISRTQSHSYDRIVRRIAADRHATAFFTGNGGDNVFAYSRSPKAIVDRFRYAPLDGGVLATLLDLCRLTGCSPWQALSGAIRVARRRSAAYPWEIERLFLHKDLVANLGRSAPSHPWLDPPTDALPGKAAHIAGLLRIQQHLVASEEAMDLAVLNPLMAQPVLEQVLSIPSWRWCQGGVDRAIARQAFAADLPAAAIVRRTKGSPDSFCVEIIDRHRADIRERLLEGRLAAAGLLDREAIAAVLASEAPTLGFEQVRLLAMLETEAWLSHWTGE